MSNRKVLCEMNGVVEHLVHSHHEERLNSGPVSLDGFVTGPLTH